MGVKHLRASPGSDRRESLHPTEGETGKKEARRRAPRSGGKAPATVRGRAGESWQDRRACRQKKPGPPCGRPGLDWDDSCEPSLNPGADQPVPQGRHAKSKHRTIQVPTAAGAAGASVGTDGAAWVGTAGADSVVTPSEITLEPLQSPFGQPPETMPPSTA